MCKSCCFFGHRKIDRTEELEGQIYENAERLILNENVDTFYFGSKSEFNSLCRDVIKELKNKYPEIKRVYIRAEFPYIDDSYKDYLLKNYEDTYFPKKAINAGKACYIKRNQEMIDKSDFCIVYYREAYLPPTKKSGTRIAYNYARQKNKPIICL